MRKLLAGFLAAAVIAAAPTPGAWAALAVSVRPVTVLQPASGVAALGATLTTPLEAPSLALPLTAPSISPILPAAPQTAVINLLPGALPAPVLRTIQAAVPGARAAAAPAPAVPAAPALNAAEAPKAPAQDAEFAAATPSTRRTLRARFAELRAAFGLKAPEAVPLDAPAAELTPLAPAAGAETAGRAAPEVPAPSVRPSRQWLGFGSALTFFLGALAVEEIGNETQAAGLPPLIAKVFGDVTISASMGIWSSVADLAGSLATPLLTKRVGLKAAYLWSAGARLVSGALTAGLLATGHMTVPLLMAASVLGAFAGGVNLTAEKAIPAVILDRDQGKLERFKAARQGVVEVMATLVPIGTGALVASLGFLPALVAFPLAAGASMLVVALTLGVPGKAAALGRPAPAAAVPSLARSLTHGARLTWRTPALRWSFAAYAFFYLMSPLLYWLLAPAYGVFIAGAGHEERAALVQGVMLGLFSLGGLVASGLVMREHRRLQPLGEAARRKALGASLLRWMKWGTAALPLVATLALPFPAFGGLTLPALALFPFGVAFVMAKLKLEAYFQSQTPPDAVDDTAAFLESGSSVLIIAGLWAAKAAFSAFSGLMPFVLFSAALIPLAAVFQWLTRRLARLTDSG